MALCITTRPTAYVAIISLGNLFPHRVATISGFLVVGPVGVTPVRPLLLASPLGLWLLLLAFATIFPTIIMTTFLVVLLGTVRLLLPEVCQGFGLRDGLINSPDLSPLQLRSGPTLQPIQKVEQHIFIREVGNLKCKGCELPHICVYAPILL